LGSHFLFILTITLYRQSFRSSVLDEGTNLATLLSTPGT